ncbi:MAG: MFS transporter [Deltaproteobacteria bacterium]|nr:MFS transporter [Deltaproteobacteria bacterium]
MTTTPMKLTLPRQLAYACGQAGNVLSESLIATYLLVLYLPPAKTGEAERSLLPALVFGLIPAMFFANLVARGIDTFLDPLVANLSDRNTNKLGRRRIFLLIGALPLCLCTAIVFFPPDEGPTGFNVAFLSLFLTGYYAFFSFYVAPYLALLPELTPDRKLNVQVSTMMAAFALVGGLIAINGGGAMIGTLGDATAAQLQGSIQTTVLVLTVVAFVLLMIPVLFIAERKLVVAPEAGPSHTGLIQSLRMTFSDRAFLPYVVGTTLFAFGFNIVRSALFYFLTVLMREPSESPASIAVFGVAALAFPVVGVLSVKLGKRKVMMAGAVILAVALSGFYFVDGVALGVVMFAVCGIGVSVFLSVPNSILSDICNANALRTGERREAMFFGAQGFLQKINLGISTGVLFFLLENQGHSIDNPLGVRLAGPVAGVVLIVAAIAYSRYPEKRITDELAAAAAKA